MGLLGLLLLQVTKSGLNPEDFNKALEKLM